MTRRFRNRNRNQDFDERRVETPGGVTSKDINTLGGPFEENRGRRNASERMERRDDNPFVTGRLYNWNHRKGWNKVIDRSFSKKAGRNHGGSQLDHDGSHFGKGPRGYKRSDDDIYDDVCTMLTLSAEVDASGIEVSVKAGCVYLRGTVNSRQIKRMAEFTIENVSGVLDVQNLLTFSASKEVPDKRQDVEARPEGIH